MVQLVHPIRGAQFTRYVRGVALTRGDLSDAPVSCGGRVPRRRGSAGCRLGRNSDAERAWGDELAPYEVAAAEFFSLVKEQSVIGGMAGIRRVPLNVKLAIQVSGAVASWVKEARQSQSADWPSRARPPCRP